MKSPLARNVVISTIVHVLVIAALLFFSYLSCRASRQPRDITTFVELQVTPPDQETAPEPEDIPDPVPQTPKKKTIEVSRKLVKQRLPEKKLTKKDIRQALRTTAPSDRQSIVHDEFARYLLRVRAVMYEAWKQPGTLSGASGLVTRALIRVRRDGRIVERKIILSSGNELMDKSVFTALESVKTLQPLPRSLGIDHEDITIDFELTQTNL
ncbi:TonB C-terminal domain-containing protein [Verrucomicrobiota bacterium]